MDRLNAVDLRYRSDPGEGNELNHEHIDAQMEQRLGGARAEFRTELEQLQTRLELPGFLFGFWIAAVIGATPLATALR